MMSIPRPRNESIFFSICWYGKKFQFHFVWLIIINKCSIMKLNFHLTNYLLIFHQRKVEKNSLSSLFSFVLFFLNDWLIWRLLFLWGCIHSWKSCFHERCPLCLLLFFMIGRQNLKIYQDWGVQFWKIPFLIISFN